MLKLFEPILVAEKLKRIPKMIIAPFCNQIEKRIFYHEDILTYYETYSEWFESAKFIGLVLMSKVKPNKDKSCEYNYHLCLSD